MRHPQLGLPIETVAIEIVQPLGAYYVCSIPASVLMQVAHSVAATILEREDTPSTYAITGIQRPQKDDRLREIGRYIDTVEAAFPNSIILAANVAPGGASIEPGDSRRWTVREDGATCVLTIPSLQPAASIIDGQHRLFGFRYATDRRQTMPLLCAVYIDIPTPYQAYLFATINFNQRKVNKSLAYELFGYGVEDEEPQSWSPEKLSVYLTRRLNTEAGSPFRERIQVAAIDAAAGMSGDRSKEEWSVSTASIVDGILSLISKSPRRDKDEMHSRPPGGSRSRLHLKDDGAPLRRLFLESNDQVTYAILLNYFVAVERALWVNAGESSYIRKTVGILALFDNLKRCLREVLDTKDISVDGFLKYLMPASTVDFSDSFFQASGVGRTRIKSVLAIKNGWARAEDFTDDTEALEHYRRLTASESERR